MLFESTAYFAVGFFVRMGQKVMQGCETVDGKKRLDTDRNGFFKRLDKGSRKTVREGRERRFDLNAGNFPVAGRRILALALFNRPAVRAGHRAVPPVSGVRDPPQA